MARRLTTKLFGMLLATVLRRLQTCADAVCCNQGWFDMFYVYVAEAVYLYPEINAGFRLLK